MSRSPQLNIGVGAWYEDIRNAIEVDVWSGLLLGLYYAYVGIWLTLSTRVRMGTNVFDRDWDVLIVLDACRVDTIRSLASEYTFIGEVDSIWSVGSTSGEWVAHTFDEAYLEEIRRTEYVTANPHSQAVLREGRTPPQYVSTPICWPAWNPVQAGAFKTLEELWRDGHSERLGTVPPRVITDRAILAGRRRPLGGRLMVHYMQPHAPYISAYLTGGMVPDRMREPFEQLRRGEMTREAVTSAYRQNLRLVLNEVEMLLDNVDAERVVITADHGEAFGEWGFYEHPVGCPLPVVKRVPWIETTAVDSRTHQPEASRAETVETGVCQQLADLGYL